MLTRARGPRGRVVGFGSVVVVCVCVVLAAPVFAFASRSVHGVVVPKFAKGSATATCPSGHHVAFGGMVAQFQPPPGSGPIVFPTGMRRTATGKWTVYGQSGSDRTGSRLTAVAYCDHGTNAPFVRERTVSVGGYAYGSVMAICPAGTVVVAGGYNTGASLDHIELVTRLDRPASTQFRASIVNITPNATVLTAYAYCGAGPAPTEYRRTVTLAGERGGTARAYCPTGKGIVFGGLVQASPGSGAHGADIAPFTWTAPSNRQWDVTGYNAGDRPGTLTSIVYCR